MPTFRYAAADRFAPPRLLPMGEPVDDVPAPQNPDPLDKLWGTVLAPGGEDCLRLHVWTPPASGGVQPRRPVLVYVPGGAYLIGSGRWGWYDGQSLATALNCVVVSFNYRLGAFGFLDLSPFGAEFADSGNLGLLDQLAALQWVQQHIATFGGDPGTVTVMGQSAGAISVGCLLGSPLATGLFHRAVCLSGGPTLVRTPEYAAEVTRLVVGRTGCADPDELRQLPMADLLAAQKWAMTRGDFGAPKFCPTVGGAVLPTYPLDRLDKSVPLLAGYTRDEMRLWKLYVPPLATLPPEAVRGWLNRLVGGRADELIGTYRRANPDEKPGNLLLAILGDVVFRLPTLRLAEAHGTAHVLRLDYTPDVPGDLGAPHALDTALLFGNFDAAGIRRYVGDAPEAARDRLREVVGAFVRDGTCDWPRYAADRSTLLVTETLTVAADPAGAERAAWDGVPFDGRRPALNDLPRKRELLAFVLKRLAVRLLPWLAGLVVLGVGWWLS